MHIEISRTWETSRSIVSRILADGEFVCYGLEPSRNTPVHSGHPCILAATYKVILTQSPHLGYLTPEVLDVPGRTAIRWHIGNKPEDVLGCVAVGRSHPMPDFVGDSKKAFHEDLMPLLLEARSAGELITATYVDPS